ncbi:MAG: hypothetical protein C5B51_25440 [Terriglobia bacterium]|nr:MAG: hypothetical protein C5B51_25440 [Terriglobia bacterium]
MCRAGCPKLLESNEILPYTEVLLARRIGLCHYAEEAVMAFLDTSSLPVIERLPGWHGRFFHSENMTFAHYNFARGSSIHEHFHPQEEVYEVIEGELEVTIDGVAQIARNGLVAIVPANVRHSVKALTDGKVIIVDYPARPDAAGVQPHHGTQ